MLLYEPAEWRFVEQAVRLIDLVDLVVAHPDEERHRSVGVGRAAGAADDILVVQQEIDVGAP